MSDEQTVATIKPTEEKLPDFVVVKLRYPISKAEAALVADKCDPTSGMLTELRMRRPKTSDRLALNKKLMNNAEREVALIEMITGVPAIVLEKMDLADYEATQEGLGKFSPTQLVQSSGSSE